MATFQILINNPLIKLKIIVKDCWDAIVETSVWAEKDLPNVLNKIKPDV